MIKLGNMNRLINALKFRFSLMSRLHKGIVTNELSTERRTLYHHLQNRKLISLEGNDSFALLQGLVTNDMQLLRGHHHSEPNLKKSVYAMMLNPQGRVLFDLMIYSTATIKEDPAKTEGFLLECDRDLAPEILKHLNVFKMRKKLDIRLRDDLKIWTIFRALPKCAAIDMQNVKNLEGDNLDLTDLDVTDKTADWCLLSRDPRLTALGYRLVLADEKSPKDVILSAASFKEADEDDYQILRYRLGVGEGAVDHPPANCFPLECNADYLHGVSFHKGCYLGQELTARTHHTGVVRKRLLPLTFNCSENDSTLLTSTISGIVTDDEEKNLGKFRGHLGVHGLALLRIQPCLDSSHRIYVKTPQNEKYQVSTYKPFWWPQES